MSSFLPSADELAQLDQRMAALGVNEADLEEMFVRSGGAGGQKVNKSSSCVMLLHRPTGLRVKCQTTRYQGMKRFLARRLLLDKIEQRQKGFVETERARIEKIRRQKRKRSRRARCTLGLWGKVQRIAENLAREGLRVLAMAYKEAAPDTMELTHDHLKTGLVLAGLQGMIDPPRPEVIGAIDGCKKAGIRVLMITGDHAVTARPIARKLGIGDKEPEVVTGRELETMSDEELFQKVNQVSVYARVSPGHKLRITRQLIKHGNIVAVTGDGVNDAPALKAAHTGISMGRSGTDVAGRWMLTTLRR